MTARSLRARLRGRTFGSGLGRALTSVAVAGTVMAGLAACGSSSPTALPDSRLPDGKKSAIGAPAAYLPKATLTDQALQGTEARPAYASQGDPVDVHVGRSVLAVTVTGPKTPPDGQVPEPSTIACTWQVTLEATKGTIPMAIGDWSVLTGETGKTYELTVAAGSRTFPRSLSPGHPVTVTLAATIVPGEGVVRFAPAGKLLASWDYIAEID